jgi:hypothetical protein
MDRKNQPNAEELCQSHDAQEAAERLPFHLQLQNM